MIAQNRTGSLFAENGSKTYRLMAHAPVVWRNPMMTHQILRNRGEADILLLIGGNGSSLHVHVDEATGLMCQRL